MTKFIEMTKMLGINQTRNVASPVREEFTPAQGEEKEEFTLRKVGATAIAPIYWIDWKSAA
jgi:hypothetical protein